jgi:hypothetical protein
MSVCRYMHYKITLRHISSSCFCKASELWLDVAGLQDYVGNGDEAVTEPTEISHKWTVMSNQYITFITIH